MARFRSGRARGSVKSYRNSFFPSVLLNQYEVDSLPVKMSVLALDVPHAPPPAPIVDVDRRPVRRACGSQ